MTATAHALVAGAIASKFPDPTTAMTLAFVSHFVMDAVPHWDFGTNWRSRPKLLTGIVAIFETLVGLLTGYLFFRTQVPFLLLTATMVASMVPDWLEAPWYVFFATAHKFAPAKTSGFWEKFTFRVYKTENFFHTKTTPVLGIITQIASVVFFLSLLR